MPRQAIVVVHGMGEQKPGQTVHPFSDMLLDKGDESYSRPTLIGDSFEARVRHIPAVGASGAPNGRLGVDTDVYEYHWSYRMKDNRLSDLGGVARQTLLPTKGVGQTLTVLLLLAGALGLAGLLHGWSRPDLSWLAGSTWSSVAESSWRVPAGVAIGVVALLALWAGLMDQRAQNHRFVHGAVRMLGYVGLGVAVVLVFWPDRRGELIAMAVVLAVGWIGGFGALAALDRRIEHIDLSPSHLLGVVTRATVIIAAALLAVWAQGIWTGIDLRWIDTPTWWAEAEMNRRFWPIDLFSIAAVLAFAAIVAGIMIVSVMTLKRQGRSLVRTFVTTCSWTIVLTVALLAAWPETWGETLALLLLAAALILMLPLTPNGLKATFIVVWLMLAWFVVALVLPQIDAIAASMRDNDGSALFNTIVKLTLGGTAFTAISFIAGRVTPWLVTSFVDVVRYIDTSPRSFEARQSIRRGLVDLLSQLHDRPPGGEDYDRIIVAAHSLGSYVSYDALTSLWYQRTTNVDLADIYGTVPQPRWHERLSDTSLTDAQRLALVEEFRASQSENFSRARQVEVDDTPVWRISDFISYGSPMSQAHRLVTKTLVEFEDLRDHRKEIVTCPPLDDVTLLAGAFVDPLPSQVRHEMGVFSTVRWLNLWYTAEVGLLGDPFGGPLAPLYGPGIKDVRVRDGALSSVPFYAHAVYHGSSTDTERGYAHQVLSVVRYE